jgi:hypothetical protein
VGPATVRYESFTTVECTIVDFSRCLARETVFRFQERVLYPYGVRPLLADIRQYYPRNVRKIGIVRTGQDDFRVAEIKREMHAFGDKLQKQKKKP